MEAHKAPSARPLELHVVAFFVTGVLVATSIVSSGFLINQHLRAERQSRARIYVIRIVLMVPIYSLEAWLALTFRLTECNKVLELLRRGYECIVLFAFLQFLVFQLGGIATLSGNLRDEQCRHLPPVRWLFYELSWTPPQRFVRRTLTGVLLYVPVSLFLALFGFLAWCIQFYFPHHWWLGQDKHFFQIVEPICNTTIGAFQLLAMYCLVLFCHANHSKLAPCRPVLKLISIKLMVFFTVWQSFGLHMANRLHAFRPAAHSSVSTWSERQICEGILNCLLVVEMFVLAWVHRYVFPAGEISSAISAVGAASAASLPISMAMTEAVLPRLSCFISAFAEVWDLSDILAFYRELRSAARTQSSDDLYGLSVIRTEERISRTRIVRSCCRYFCNYFGGATAPRSPPRSPRSPRSPRLLRSPLRQGQCVVEVGRNSGLADA